MSLPTLDQFLAREKFPFNSFVDEPGFVELYVRKNKRFLDGETREVLDIARVEVEVEGTGTFTRLVERLHARGLTVFVECVLNHRFRRALLRHGFTESERSPQCYKFPVRNPAPPASSG